MNALLIAAVMGVLLALVHTALDRRQRQNRREALADSAAHPPVALHVRGEEVDLPARGYSRYSAACGVDELLIEDYAAFAEAGERHAELPFEQQVRRI